MVERWYNRLEETNVKPLQSQNQEAVEDAIWQRLTDSNLVPAPEARIIQHPASFWQASPLKWIAAILVLGVAFQLLYQTKQLQRLFRSSSAAVASSWTLRENNTRQTQKFVLPDGSRIVLHPGSSLQYATAFAGAKRRVFLEGEAFFDVHKNPKRPFLVFTKQVVTTVLGTSFRVKAYASSNEASVAVREGKVAVQARKGAKLDATPARPAATGVLLLPNEQVVYSTTSTQLKKRLVAKPVLLQPQPFAFEERPVTEVLSALEQAYGVDIVYDKVKLAGCTVSISFDNESLFEKLGLLCKSMGTSYTLASTQVVFHSVGCGLNHK